MLSLPCSTTKSNSRKGLFSIKEKLLSLCRITENPTEKILAMLSEYGDCYIDNLGSIICRVINQNNPEHIMLDAHLDKVEFVVTDILPDGFLRVSNIGGIDTRILPSLEVIVHGKQQLRGIFATVPPHLKTDSSGDCPKLEQLSIDAGYSFDEVCKLVSPGDRVSFLHHPLELQGNNIAVNSADDRAGCAVLLDVLDKLKDSGLACDLTVVFSNFEETGLQGSTTASYSLEPTLAVAVDTTFGFSPDCPVHKCGILGKGAMIGISPILDKKLSEDFIAIAKKNNIPYQTEIMHRTTGTNADVITTSKKGVRTALLSIPIRYMHTDFETVNLHDLETTSKLITEFILHKFSK